jgi:hypothetical protein
MTRASLVAVAFALAAPEVALADEIEENFVYMPAPNAEQLVIDQPLGKLTIRGWDNPEVRIHSSKRAHDGATLDRLKVSVEMAGGQIRIQTGVRVGETFRPMPVESATIDLTIDAPRQARLHAATWSGDLSASGFSAGAELASSSGEVRAHDIQGKVVSHVLKGRQWLEAIRGDVDANAEAGDLELQRIDGDVLNAHVVEGQITARDVTARFVRVLAAGGDVVFIGTLRRGSSYVIRAENDVHLTLKPAPFTLRASAGGRVRSGFKLDGRLAPQTIEADYQGGGASLDLAAARGSVIVEPSR